MSLHNKHVWMGIQGIQGILLQPPVNCHARLQGSVGNEMRLLPPGQTIGSPYLSESIAVFP